MNREAYSDAWQKTTKQPPPKSRNLYQQNYFCITGNSEGSKTFETIGIVGSMEHLNLATADLPGIGLNILTLYGNVAAVKKSQNGVVIQVKPKQDGYDYVRIDDPSILPYKLLPDGCKLADFVFIDDQGNVLDRLTHDLPL